MTQRILFRATSPLGYPVVLTRNRWREIVRFKHPAVEQHERHAEQCISQPEVVRASAKDADVHLHYLPLAPNQYLCVVVAPGSTEEHFVVTAYLTDRLKQGDELWKK